MPNPSPSLAPVDMPARPACPHCGGAVDRVPRRLMDHLISAWTPLRRYSCRAMACRWEGTLRDEGFDLAPGDSAKRFVHRIDSY